MNANTIPAGFVLVPREPGDQQFRDAISVYLRHPGDELASWRAAWVAMIASALSTTSLAEAADAGTLAGLVLVVDESIPDGRVHVMQNNKQIATITNIAAAPALPRAPVVGEAPTGAIFNGRALADRLEWTGFECVGGDLRLCSDWVEFRRCFEHLADFVAHETPNVSDNGACVQPASGEVAEAGQVEAEPDEACPNRFICAGRCGNRCAEVMEAAPSLKAVAPHFCQAWGSCDFCSICGQAMPVATGPTALAATPASPQAPAPQAVVGEASEREAFEAAMKKRWGWADSIFRVSAALNGGYYENSARGAWQAWRLARELAPTPSPAPSAAPQEAQRTRAIRMAADALSHAYVRAQEVEDRVMYRSAGLLLDMLFATPQAAEPASAAPHQGADALREDAERYRWLHDKSVPPHNFYISVPAEFYGVRYTPDEVDAGIDAARAALAHHQAPQQGEQHE